MYLKSIEIHGFKSFANKIVFKFHNGITGIVGPNGSGKSNVADAVRWVLGEQRIKQLRGASMQDVIFAGTEMRKPLGYAYVAITLDNSDHQLATSYDEVTVARRIYRSGESEYLLNGTPCRLKDVNELFYDTGIGKEGYSIIGQGQIDKILSGKPEERRELFDEAAGIVKFKKRKIAAQKKLEDEKQNLVRVNDILSELEKQIGPLEKQSEKAKVYLKKREELKTLDVNMFLLENERLQRELQDVQGKFEIASDDLSKTSEQYEKTKEEYEQIESTIAQLDEEIEAARETLTDTGMLRGKLEGQINVLKEQIRSARSNEEHFRSRKEAVQKEMDAKLLDKEKILGEKEVIDNKVAEIEQSRNEAREKLLAIVDKKPVLAILYQMDTYPLKKEASTDAVSVGNVASGTQLEIQDIAWDADGTVFYKVQASVNGTALSGYVEGTYVVTNDQDFNEWKSDVLSEVSENVFSIEADLIPDSVGTYSVRQNSCRHLQCYCNSHKNSCKPHPSFFHNRYPFFFILLVCLLFYCFKQITVFFDNHIP